VLNWAKTKARKDLALINAVRGPQGPKKEDFRKIKKSSRSIYQKTGPKGPKGKIFKKFKKLS